MKQEVLVPQEVAPPVSIGKSAEKSIQETVLEMNKVRAFIKEALDGPSVHKETKRRVAGIDFDDFPGTKKPVLLQPGAEKVALYLGVRPQYDIVTRELKDGHVEYEIVCTLFSQKTGDIINQGVASASTMESKYRFRWINTDEEHDKGEARELTLQGVGRYKKVWLTRGQEWVWQKRYDNLNIYDQRHTVKLMGVKRAFLKAVRTMAALSEIFTQDVEDFPSVGEVEHPVTETQNEVQPTDLAGGKPKAESGQEEPKQESPSDEPKTQEREKKPKKRGRPKKDSTPTASGPQPDRSQLTPQQLGIEVVSRLKDALGGNTGTLVKKYVLAVTKSKKIDSKTAAPVLLALLEQLDSSESFAKVAEAVRMIAEKGVK